MQSFDISHLPIHVQTAITSIGGPADLRLRTTLRRDDVDVWTTWLPVQGYYETLVRTEAVDVLRLFRASGGTTETRTDTPQAARDMHEAVCAQVRRVLVRLRGVAS